MEVKSKADKLESTTQVKRLKEDPLQTDSKEEIVKVVTEETKEALTVLQETMQPQSSSEIFHSEQQLTQ